MIRFVYPYFGRWANLMMSIWMVSAHRPSDIDSCDLSVGDLSVGDFLVGDLSGATLVEIALFSNPIDRIKKGQYEN